MYGSDATGREQLIGMGHPYLFSARKKIEKNNHGMRSSISAIGQKDPETV